MAKRGEELRTHILWAAKTVFLELGFERASMDVVASRAHTSKRSVYAHFQNKETLFLAVIELVRGLFLAELRMPQDYSSQPSEALTLFCVRYLEILIFESSVQMMRVSTAESARFPEQAAAYYDVVFSQVHERVMTYLKLTFHISSPASRDAAHRLLGHVLYPRFQRALFGLDRLAPSVPAEGSTPARDQKRIKTAVTDLLETLR